MAILCHLANQLSIPIRSCEVRALFQELQQLRLARHAQQRHLITKSVGEFFDPVSVQRILVVPSRP